MPLHHHVERIVPAINPTRDIVRSRGQLSSKDTRRIFRTASIVNGSSLLARNLSKYEAIYSQFIFNN
jgi:hypothetical protein